MAEMRVWIGGGSMKSKFIKSLMPIAFSKRTVFARLVRCISGIDVGNISFLNASSVYNLKHLPGPVLPARPALYLADAYDIGLTTRVSIPSFGLYTFILANPGSTT